MGVSEVTIGVALVSFDITAGVCMVIGVSMVLGGCGSDAVGGKADGMLDGLGIRPDWMVTSAWGPATVGMLFGVQLFPVIVQTTCSSAGERGPGLEGGPIASSPLAPPRLTVTSCPAPKYCVCPYEVISPTPVYRPTSMFPLLFAFKLAFPSGSNPSRSLRTSTLLHPAC